jgi:peptidoglycan LD-endopeptidase CwlK
MFDFTVLEGHRDKEAQNKAYKEGKSKIKWPDGKHNKKPSLAFDLAPYPIDFSSKPKSVARYYLLAGIIMAVAWELKIKLRWGGDWDGDWDLADQVFDDLGHFEILEG